MFAQRLRLIVTILLFFGAAAWRPDPVHAQTPTPGAPVATPASTLPPTPTAPPPVVTTPLVDPALAAEAPPAPPGFVLIDAAHGAWLFRKPYANGSPDFVQVIDLRKGARVQLLHGDITEQRPEKGSYGGPDPRMKSPALETYWNNVSSQDPLAFCVINGSFFYMPEYPTRLAFPLKVGGGLVTEGWGIKTYENQKMMLELWDGKADIHPLSKESLYASSAPDILGGLSEDANKRIKYAVGRTFTGVSDRDANGEYDTLLFLSTKTALQSGAAGVLREFGAGKVMMLDGGGSTQLLCRSGWHVRSDRPIPQAVAIFSGKPPEVQAELVRSPAWQALIEGERPQLELEVRNTGSIPWTETTTQFVIDPSPAAVAQALPIRGEVPPGGTAIFSTTLPAFEETGLQQVEVPWKVSGAAETFNGPAVVVKAVVVPARLADRLPELRPLLAEWSTSDPQNVEAQAQAWLEQQAPTPAPQPTGSPALSVVAQINPQDVIWIPALMLPIILILGLLLIRRNIG